MPNLHLEAIRQRLGPPPRKLGWFKPSPIEFPEPPWLANVSVQDDMAKELFGAFKTIWKHGVVVWGFVVRANARLFRAGGDDCPGTVIFSPSDDDESALALLPRYAEQLHRLADTSSPNPAWSTREREWWEDLHTDLSYHRGFKLPETWQSNHRDYKATGFVFHRPHLPGGIIQSNLLPILVDPVGNLGQIVPASYWPPGLAEWLSAQQGATDPKSEGDSTDFLAADPIARQAREEAYEAVFGPIVSVLHEVIPSPHHIDIYRFAWAAPRDEHGYVSGGMSNALQPEGGDFARIELVFYSRQPDERFAEMLRVFARYPWQTGEAIMPGDTIPLERHAEAVLGSDRFPALLFCPGVANSESELCQQPAFTASNTRFLTVVPLTRAELEFKLTHGAQALFERMQAGHFDMAFTPDRASVV